MRMGWRKQILPLFNKIRWSAIEFKIFFRWRRNKFKSNSLDWLTGRKNVAFSFSSDITVRWIEEKKKKKCKRIWINASQWHSDIWYELMKYCPFIRIMLPSRAISDRIFTQDRFSQRKSWEKNSNKIFLKDSVNKMSVAIKKVSKLKVPTESPVL